MTGFDHSVLQIKTKIVSYHTANYKPVKQEVNGTVILPPLVVPALTYKRIRCSLGATTFSITTFSIMTLSIKGLFLTLSINDIQHKRHSA